MLLLNPRNPTRFYPDEGSRQIMLKTIAFFEEKGKARIKEDDHKRTWYADFIEFQKKEKIFATLLTPTPYGESGCRWDTWRNCEFNEILGFYGLAYWYTWQVSILGLGPIWMSANEALKKKAAQLLREGEVFAFGLSEREHGADIYSTEMSLTPQPDGTYLANGEKYYIGNGNVAPMVSTFGKFADTGEYVFFAADYRHRNYNLIKNVTDSQSYVANFALKDYPITEAEILHQRTGSLGCGAEHGQHRQVQPGLGFDRHLHARVLRSHPSCCEPPPVRHGRHRFPARQADVHGCLCPPGGDEAVCPARRGLHARRLAG